MKFNYFKIKKGTNKFITIYSKYLLWSLVYRISSTKSSQQNLTPRQKQWWFIISIMLLMPLNSVYSQKPYVETRSAILITDTSALLRGYVEAIGDPNEIHWFEWGPTLSLGTVTKPRALDTDSGEFTEILAGLTPATTYYFRAVADNKDGLSLGKILSFRTLRGSSQEFSNELLDLSIYSPQQSISPDSTIEYTLEYGNKSDKQIEQISVEIIFPPEISYIKNENGIPAVFYGRNTVLLSQGVLSPYEMKSIRIKAAAANKLKNKRAVTTRVRMTYTLKGSSQYQHAYSYFVHLVEIPSPAKEGSFLPRIFSLLLKVIMPIVAASGIAILGIKIYRSKKEKQKRTKPSKKPFIGKFLKRKEKSAKQASAPYPGIPEI